jgi:hypothetical protein
MKPTRRFRLNSEILAAVLAVQILVDHFLLPHVR